MSKRILAAAGALLALPLFTGHALAGPEPLETPQGAPASVEVAFVLDTTGSMSGLIDGARKKIWSIADEIRKQRPEARIRFALVGYRDRGDLYVTDVTDLTDDLHAVYGKLVGFQASGGGDWPESVNEALNVAVTRLDWTGDAAARRMIFLVGDAPPHMDYEQDVTFQDSLRIANREGIVVHAVQAGDAGDTEFAWRAIAALGRGDYMAIPQSGNVSVVETPYDGQIRELQLKLNLTVVPYGRKALREEVEEKLRLKAIAPAPAVSDMAAYESRDPAAAAGSVVGGEGDLVADAQAGRIDVGDADMPDLPSDWAAMDGPARAARLDGLVETRKRLKGEIAEQVALRDRWLAENAPDPADGGDSFDGAVKKSLAKSLR